METKETSRVRVLRFDPEKSPSPFYQDYIIPYERQNTILDALYYIYRQIDGTLAFRASCFAGGWCCVCMMKVNGKVLLACKHFMEKEMVIEPPPGYPVLKDLIVDYGARRKKESCDSDQHHPAGGGQLHRQFRRRGCP